jgi:hypothetical protein
MNFVVNNQEHFRLIQLYAELTLEIVMFFIDQLPTFHVFRKVRTILASEFSTTYHVVSKAL